MIEDAKTPQVAVIEKKAPTLYLIVAIKIIKGVLLLLVALGFYALAGKDLEDLFDRFTHLGVGSLDSAGVHSAFEIAGHGNFSGSGETKSAACSSDMTKRRPSQGPPPICTLMLVPVRV